MKLQRREGSLRQTPWPPAGQRSPPSPISCPSPMTPAPPWWDSELMVVNKSLWNEWIMTRSVILLYVFWAMSVLKSNFFAKKVFHTSVVALYQARCALCNSGCNWKCRTCPRRREGAPPPPSVEPYFYSCSAGNTKGFTLKPKQGRFLEQSRSAGRGAGRRGAAGDRPWD